MLVEEARGAVRAAVAALTGRRQRLVHALFYRPERDYVSLADELGMPVGSIGPTRGRVLRALRGPWSRPGSARRWLPTRGIRRCTRPPAAR